VTETVTAIVDQTDDPMNANKRMEADGLIVIAVIADNDCSSSAAIQGQEQDRDRDQALQLSNHALKCMVHLMNPSTS